MKNNESLTGTTEFMENSVVGINKNHVDILIVEDSPTQVEQLSYLFEKHSYSVAIADNGKEALKFLEENDSTIIISDICMPEMDGLDFCRRVKADDRLKDVPVILLTSLSNPEDVIEGLACGADNFITKPYNDEYLLMHVSQIIANRKLNKTVRVHIGLEFVFGNKRRVISTDQQQMLSMLISTFEAGVTMDKELVETKEKLRALMGKMDAMAKRHEAEMKRALKFRERT